MVFFKHYKISSSYNCKQSKYEKIPKDKDWPIGKMGRILFLEEDYELAVTENGQRNYLN